MNIREELLNLQDEEYRAFHIRLMPTVSPEKVIGVRVPHLRKLAKEFSKTTESGDFLKQLPHKYYEENNIHAFLIERISDFDVVVAETEKFLPYIDNWATCDMFVPIEFKKHPKRLLPYVGKWLKSDHPYTVRYGIKVLMDMFLDNRFKVEYFETVSKIKSDEYYVKMMVAWYFATALAKQYEAALPFITENRLDIWTHNKTIQKTLESNRIDAKTKAFLKKLKRK